MEQIINQIKKDLEKNNIKDNVEITQSNKHYFLNVNSKRFDIFRAFETITELKTYLYNTLKIKGGVTNE